MKKYYYSLCAAATMLLATTSCSQEEDFSQSSGEMTTFEINLEGVAQSRTAGDGMTANKLYYEVYQDTKKVIDNYGTDKTDGHDVVTMTDGKATVKMPLMKGETYKLIFWAQFDEWTEDETAIYDPTDLKNIKVTYATGEGDSQTSAVTANNEKYDAFFYGNSTFKATSNVTKIQLRRPFAQLNIGTTEADWELAKTMIDGELAPVTASSVTVTGLANAFNALDGEATGSANVQFTQANLNGETFAAKNDTYYNLAMNYLLVPGKVSEQTTEVKSTTTVTAEFWRGETSLFTIKNLVNVPIQRNYRTNILGNLLADNKTFEIEIVPEFDGDHNYPETDEEKLRMAAATGGSVTLTGDLTLSESLEIDYDMTIDLGGHTLTVATKEGANVVTDIKNNATLHISNGKITAEDNELSRRCIYNYGTMTIDGVEFTQTYNQKGAAINNEGKMIIEDATVNAMYYAIWNSGENAELIINGGTFVSNNDAKLSNNDKNWCYAVNNQDKAKMIVNGGTFKGNHGTISANSESQVILKGGSYECTGVYSEGGSDWVLYANAAMITYYDGCTFTHPTKTGHDATCTKDNGIINKAREIKNQTITETVVINDDMTLILDEVNITTSTGPAIQIAEGKKVIIYILNNVNLNGATTAIEVPETSEVTIKGVADALNSLTARAASQYGNLMAEGKAGSGIGGAGKITIADIKRLTAKGNGEHAFGIGDNEAVVSINNSYIDYVCGGCVQPLFISDTKYGKSEPEGGAAIGGAEINLDGVTIKKADGGSKAAGIGAQYWQSTKITIKNSTIEEVNGGNASAGIGGSRFYDINSKDWKIENKQSIDILIENSIITANGGQFAAGIGAGYDTHCLANNTNAVNNIQIVNSTITAKGGKYAAGIGTGYHSAALTGSIDAASVINAIPGESREKYTIAQAIGYGVVDPAREMENQTVTFTVAGEVIDDPTKVSIITSEYISRIAEGGIFELAEDIAVSKDNNIHTQTATNDITINGNGYTIVSTAESVDDFQWDETFTFACMSTIFSSSNGSKITVNDLNFSGTMAALNLGHYVKGTPDAQSNYITECNNVNVVNTEVVSFSSGISPAVCIYGKAVLNNCNVYGTKLSSLDTNPMWPVYDLAAVNYTDITLNGGKYGSIYMWNQAKMTIGDKAVVETIVIRGNMNANKYGLTIKAGASVSAIDLSAITETQRVNITIEDGVAVKFVDNGTEYKTLDDWKNAQ